MSIHRRLTTLALTALAATVLVLWVSSAMAVDSSSFSQQGNYFSGWYWMTTNGQTNTWTFNPPAKAALDAFEGCELEFVALVTHTTSGGGGHSKKVNQYLSLSTPTVPEKRFKFELVNPSTNVTWTDSQGRDYATRKVFLNPAGMSATDRDNLQKICDSYMAERDGKPGQRLTVKYVWQETREACCAGKMDASGRSYPHHVAVNANSVKVYFWK